MASLDALLDAAPTIAQKRYREALLAHRRRRAIASRELARIRTDVPVTFDADALRYRGPSRERCFTLFSSLGFRTLVAEYAPTAETSARDYAVVASLEDVDALATELRAAGRIGVGADRDGDRRRCTSRVVGWAFAPTPGTRALHPARATRASPTRRTCPPREVFARLGPVLADPSDREGRPRPEVRRDRAARGTASVLAGVDVDTMVASYLVDATRSSHDLEGLALERAELPRGDATRTLTGQRRQGGHARRGAGGVAARRYAGERADLPLDAGAGLAERSRAGRPRRASIATSSGR